MNKQDISIVVLLFAGFFGWMLFQARHQADIKKNMPTVEQSAQEQTTEPSPDSGKTATNKPPAVIQLQTNKVAVAETPETTAKKPGTVLLPEETLTLTNDLAVITISSHGAAVTTVELKKYREKNSSDSPAVQLDFSKQAALSVTGFENISTNSDFILSVIDEHKSVKAVSEDGAVVLERTISLDEGYVLSIVDSYSNKSDAPVVMDDVAICLGPMQSVATTASARGGYAYLGLDTYHGKTDGITIWAKSGPKGDKPSLAKRFRDVNSRGG